MLWAPIESTWNSKVVRGFDYYTRTTFEFQVDSIGAQSTICGGGRYDGLVEEIGGPPTPGVGFGAGIERLTIALAEQGIAVEEPGIDVFFVCTEEAARAEILAVMAELRHRGRRCDTDYAGRSLRGQLTQAGRLGARLTVLAGADRATIRRRGADDEEVPLTDLATRLSA